MYVNRCMYMSGKNQTRAYISTLSLGYMSPTVSFSEVSRLLFENIILVILQGNNDFGHYMLLLCGY